MYIYKIRKAISLIFFRRFKVKKMKRLINNHEFSIISNNCVGGLIYKDLNKKFLTPTIGLFIKNKDFVKFVSNINEYINDYEIEEVKIAGIEYPCGKLKDITIYFMHYDNFEEAKSKWDERKKRINYNNLFVLMSMDDTFDNNIFGEFNKLNFNKILFSAKPYPNYNYIKYIPGFEKGYLEDITRYCNIFGTKFYEYKFDIIKFLNNKDVGDY